VDLKDFIKALNKHLRASLLVSFGLFVVVFFVSYLLPVKYKSVGSLYVLRQDENVTRAYFTYEGYYASQTAERYTDTVVGLLKSVDIKREALEKAGIAFDAKALAKLESSLIIKKVAPQVVQISLKGSDTDYVDVVWEALAQSVIESSEVLNSKGDSSLAISFVSDPSHVVYESSSSPLFIAFIAFLLGNFVSIFVLSFKSYMKG